MGSFRFHIKDFGCRINQYDSRLIQKNLIRMGRISVSLKDADVVLINTCSVTHRAARDGIKYSRRIRRAYPEKEILAMGCAVRDNTAEYEKAGVKTHAQFKYLDNPRNLITRFYGHTRAFIKIQQGCKSTCTYCVVKRLKKPYFIKSPDQVIHEMEVLSKNHPELVICATNFNEYAELLELIHGVKKINADFRWRFSSLPPESLTEQLLQSLSEDTRFCRHFHIPIQSANDTVLGMMKRGYTVKMAVESILRTKKILKGAVFSFDIMVGFPGETEKMFRDTISFIEIFSPVKVHVFRYSDRPLTPACYYDKKLPERVKKERLTEIVELSEKIRKKHFADTRGKIKEVVIENNNKGYTREYLPVKLVNYASHAVIERVKIIDYSPKQLIGKICDKENTTKKI